MSNTSEKLYQRRSVRLESYDYRQPGFYFVTICTHNKLWHLGSVIDDKIHINPVGSIVQEEWDKLPTRFKHVRLDLFAVMPNHFHGILIFEEPESGLLQDKDQNIAKVPTRFRQYLNHTEDMQQVDLNNFHQIPKKLTIAKEEVSSPDDSLPTLGEVIRTFKGAATYRIHTKFKPTFAWERGMYEHVVRNPRDLERIRHYIINNPIRWQEDTLLQKRS